MMEYKINKFVVTIKTTEEDIRDLLDTAVTKFDPEIPYFKIIDVKKEKLTEVILTEVI